MNVVPFAMLTPHVVVRLSETGATATMVAAYGMASFLAILAKSPITPWLLSKLDLRGAHLLGLSLAGLGTETVAVDWGPDSEFQTHKIIHGAGKREFFVQSSSSHVIELDGATAAARYYVTETARSIQVPAISTSQCMRTVLSKRVASGALKAGPTTFFISTKPHRSALLSRAETTGVNLGTFPRTANPPAG